MRSSSFVKVRCYPKPPWPSMGAIPLPTDATRTARTNDSRLSAGIRISSARGVGQEQLKQGLPASLIAGNCQAFMPSSATTKARCTVCSPDVEATPKARRKSLMNSASGRRSEHHKELRRRHASLPEIRMPGYQTSLARHRADGDDDAEAY